MVIAYEISERLAKVAAKVIAEHDDLKHLDDPDCRIAYQTSSQEKKNGAKTVYADTERVKDKLKSVLPFDFIITFYWPNCENLTEEKLCLPFEFLG